MTWSSSVDGVYSAAMNMHGWINHCDDDDLQFSVCEIMFVNLKKYQVGLSALMR